MTPDQAKQLSETRLVVAGIQQSIEEIQNALAGYATTDGKRADGIAPNPAKRLSFIGEMGKKLGLVR